jgi:CHAT domain-containing protein
VIEGLGAVERRLCHNGPLNSPYVALVSRRGRFTGIAEGYAQVADVLATGLRVTSGVAPPPAAAQNQSSQAAAAIAADFGGEMTGLASAEKAAAADGKRLLARGYVQNSEWRFDAAETDFRALAASVQAQNAPPADQALALLNLALNISNSGRFAEAADLFDRADRLVAAAGDQALRAEALNYRAYDLRNQRRFAEAAQTARDALAARAVARRTATFSVSPRQTVITDDATTISSGLAEALRTRPGSRALLSDDQIDPEIRLTIQDAEAREIEGSSELAIDDPKDARAVLEQARRDLKVAEDAGAETTALRSRVEADTGDLELAEGRADVAVERYQTALTVLRTSHSGSPPEGGLLLDLGRAQIAAGHTDAALAAFDDAFAVFKRARGALGDSADGAEPYLDLLIDLMRQFPDKAADYERRYFAAAEAVTSGATADTISRLAARVASGDDATAGLVRAVDDTRRALSAAESRIAALQARNAYVGEAKISADAELKQLQAQLAAVNSALLTANPRYDQLVSSDASLEDLQKALRPDEAYAKVLLLSDRGYGMLVTRETVNAYAIPLRREVVIKMAGDLRAPLEASDESLRAFDVAGAHKLFEALFGPVAGPLLKARHLIYEPDEQLVSLPVGVLVTDQASVDLMAARGLKQQDYRGVGWLAARLDSSIALSAASFLQARQVQPSHARRSFLGFGAPSFARTESRAYASLLQSAALESGPGGLGARGVKVCEATRRTLLKIDLLPDTDKEVHVVAASLGASSADVVVGPAFNDASLRARTDLNDYRILYFATHALLPMPYACLPEPALVTSLGGDGSDGLLDASEIVNLKLDAELVVLSACDTGGAGSSDASATGLRGGGEALGGLTRAFIYAGARGMIVSHWSVDSAATERLMTHMFLARSDSLSRALQRAQLEMQSDQILSHPYFWAPFTIIGDGARVISAEAHAS